MARKKIFKIKPIRWGVVIGLSILFILSFRLDIQILEGSLSGSRFIGFHLIDPFVTIQVMASHFVMPTNLIIGTVTILLFYLIAGGRAFCSWVCPYGLLSEWASSINSVLIKRGIIKRRKVFTGFKYFFWVLWVMLAFASGALIFETFNVVSILSRFLIYGFSFAILFVILLLISEVFIAPRFWCLNICPVGATYGLLNIISAGKITRQGECDHCGRCEKACHAPHLLAFLNDPLSKQKYIKGTDCTLCGNCMDACPNGCLSYHNRLKDIV